MANYIRNLYRQVGYALTSITFRSNNVIAEQLKYHLAKMEIGLGELNTYMDEHDFPLATGRFPRLLNERPDLTPTLLSYLEQLKQKHSKGLTRLREDHRRNVIISRLAKKVAHEW